MATKLGDLEILDMVATGGMAEVYRARLNTKEGEGKQFAVKRILPQFTKDADLVQMSIDEAKVAQQLRNVNIVQVYDLAISDSGDYYIVMEFADGKDLADVIYAASIKGIKITPAVATQIARETLL